MSHMLQNRFFFVGSYVVATSLWYDNENPHMQFLTKDPFTINYEWAFFRDEGEWWGLDICNKRSDNFTPVAFFVWTFVVVRWSVEGGGKNLKNQNVPRTLIVNDP